MRIFSMFCALLVSASAYAQSLNCTQPGVGLDNSGIRLERAVDDTGPVLPGSTPVRYGPFKEYELASVSVSMSMDTAPEGDVDYFLRVRVTVAWDDGEFEVLDLTPLRSSVAALPTLHLLQPAKPIVSFDVRESRHTDVTYLLDLARQRVGRFSCGSESTSTRIAPRETTFCSWSEALNDFDCTIEIDSTVGLRRSARRHLELLSQRELPVDVGEHPWYPSIDAAGSDLFEKRFKGPVIRGIGLLGILFDYQDFTVFVADGTTEWADARFFVFTHSPQKFEEIESHCIGECPENERAYSAAWKESTRQATPLPAKFGYRPNSLTAICNQSPTEVPPTRVMFERDNEYSLYWLARVTGDAGTARVLRVAITSPPGDANRPPSLSSVALADGCEFRAEGTLERGDCSSPVVITLGDGFEVKASDKCAGPPHEVRISDEGQLGAVVQPYRH